MISDKVLNIANDIFRCEVDENSKINDFERWDSLGQLTFFMELENKLELKFSHEEIITTNTMSDIITLVKNKTHIN